MSRLARTPMQTMACSAAAICSMAAMAPTSATAASTAATQAAARLPQADYAVRQACAPPAPGRAGCLALVLEPKGTTAKAKFVHLLAATRARSEADERSGVESRSGIGEAECALYVSTCMTPEDLRAAYFPGEAPDAPAGEPQTIALVDAYNDPNAEADLGTYSSEFGLPQCTKATGCFKQVGESGAEGQANLPFPKTKAELEAFAGGNAHERELAGEAESWALETATDVEVAHAICHDCHILLVAATSPEYAELGAAENTAAQHAQEISDSWGGREAGGDSPDFDHRGIVITAAAGDDGYLNWDQYASREEPESPYFQGADYPASSPHVVSVGGTRLTLSLDGTWSGESVWNSSGAGGSGCSGSLTAPEWQSSVEDWSQVGCGSHRANADVSADADPATGVNVYDSVPYPYESGTAVPHWLPIGGTSVASPVIAAMFALAGGAHGVDYPARTLYSHLGTSLLHDVTTGGSGECDGQYASCSGSMNPLSPFYPLDCGQGAWICNATSGYDGPTGVGTPNGIAALAPGESSAPGSEPPSEPGPAPGSGTGGSGGSGTGGSGSGGSGSGGGQTPGSGGTTSAGEETGSVQPPVQPGALPTGFTPTTGATGNETSATGTPSGSPGARTARISKLELTTRTRVALLHGRVSIGQIAFSFDLSRARIVRATLAVKVGTGRRAHWRTLPHSLRFAAIAGVNRRRLHGSGRLTRGTYRLEIDFVNEAGRRYSRALVFSM